MPITAAAIKELRDKTGAGMMDCRAALTEADGDVVKAEGILARRGAATAEKKSGRETSQGLVEAYIHPGGKYGSLIEVNCETDFVARTDAFKELVRDIAIHVTGASPTPSFVDQDSIPSDVLEAKRTQLRLEAEEEGGNKPQNVIDRMIDGRMKKYVEEACLLDQPWVRDPEKTIRQLIQQAVQVTNENIKVRRFARFQLGGE